MKKDLFDADYHIHTRDSRSGADDRDLPQEVHPGSAQVPGNIPPADHHQLRHPGRMRAEHRQRIRFPAVHAQLVRIRRRFPSGHVPVRGRPQQDRDQRLSRGL